MDWYKYLFSILALVALLARQGKHKLVAISGSIKLFAKIGANYVSVPIMGIGIMIATGIMLMDSFVQLYWFAIIY